ncbi:MAG: phosphodiester glycosidase family protein [Candidatus Levybacteria bacterium]|nr:phosphodiester glycosidase family protein [Candidatus Levybacteria bacterium]
MLLNKLSKLKKYLVKILFALIIISLFVSSFYFFESAKYKTQVLDLTITLDKSKKDLNELKNQDQLKINEQLKIDIKKTHDTYSQTIKPYEKILDLKAQKQDTKELEKTYAEIIKYLSDLNYSSSSALLTTLNADLNKKYSALAAAQSTTPANQTATVNNSPPGSGYSFQAVKTDSGIFNVAIIAADLNSTKVIIDTASDSDCKDNCPVMALGDYVARSGAYAGINGPFFCPAEYPSCAGKTNSFDTLLMNKNKHYFNSDNNKYSTVPLMYFSGNSAGARGQTLDWGRDTGVDSVIANFPLYISGGNNNFGGSSDPKINSSGARTFVANKGNYAYIGIVYNASAAQAAAVLKTLGMENALGLDQGGSTALWSNGYKAGPGRGLPSALLFVRK